MTNSVQCGGSTILLSSHQGHILPTSRSSKRRLNVISALNETSRCQSTIEHSSDEIDEADLA